MTRLADVCAELAVRYRAVVPFTAYPAPATLSGNQPMAIVYGGNGSLVYRGGSEQEWLDTIRVQILIAPATTPQALGALDDLVEPIADLFDANVSEKHTLGYRVDFCHLASYELGQIIEFANVSYYGATFLHQVKRRRFAGDA